MIAEENCFICECTKPGNTCSRCSFSNTSQKEKIFGKYRLMGKIGEGSYGLVYKAEHTELGSPAAIKILANKNNQSEDVIERFRRESIAAGTLRHPLALKIFDRGEEGNLLWIAMELLDGNTLEDLLENGLQLSPEELVSWMSPLCEVLTEAHQKGIIHRDLKPGNLMVTQGLGGQSILRLMDFGMVDIRGASKLTEPNLVSGTPRYMAPEQWRGLSFADERSDVYSLGVIAYQCLSRKLPFDADTPIGWLKKHQSEQPLDLKEAVAPKSLPVGVIFAVMRAIAKDPENRQQSIQCFLEEIRNETNKTASEPMAISVPVSKEAFSRYTLPVFVLVLCGIVALGLQLKAPKRTNNLVPGAEQPTHQNPIPVLPVSDDEFVQQTPTECPASTGIECYSDSPLDIYQPIQPASSKPVTPVVSSLQSTTVSKSKTPTRNTNKPQQATTLPSGDVETIDPWKIR